MKRLDKPAKASEGTGVAPRRASDRGAAALARRYGDALRAGDGGSARRIVDEAFAAGMAPQAVQSLVITPAMVRIGELWESGVIGVADEHLATSISQTALIRVFEVIKAQGRRERSRERILLAAIEGQHHVLGLRMVADVLEGAGFDVLYLGDNVPVDSLRSFVEQHRPAAVGLTMGLYAEVGLLADSLLAVHEVAPETRIMLGGRAIPPGLRSAEYPYVTSTMDVVEVVEDLLAGPVQSVPEIVLGLALQVHRQGMGQPREAVLERDAVAASLADAAEQAVDLARVQVRRAEAYRDLAFRDALTDLPNRRAFDDALHEILEAPGGGGALVMIDVDGFKEVNDGQGHQQGDRLLRTIAGAIAGAIRPSDVAARFGGDEFAVLVPGATSQQAGIVADRIRAAVSAAAAPISISLGVAGLSGDSRGAVLAADTALYAAKAAGRNQVAIAGDDPVRTVEAG